MSEYVTNVVVEKHSVWTLTKHIADSVNKTAAKIDAKVYGTTTNVIIVPVPENHPVKDGIILVGGSLLGVVIIGLLFWAYCAGHVKGRDFIGI